MPTTDTKHSRKSVSNGGLHGTVSIWYDNATDRGTDTRAGGYDQAFISDDEGRVAKQLDDNSLWILKKISPLTWNPFDGAGEANTASNLPGSKGIFASKSGVDLRFKSLNGGDGVTLTSNANTITISSPFGLDYQFAEDETLDTTSGSVFLDKLSLTTPAGLLGTYLVVWSARVRHSVASQKMEARLFESTAGVVVGQVFVMEPKDPNNRIIVSSPRHVVFTGTSKQFVVQYRVQPSNGGTAGIDGVVIYLYRVL